MAVVVVATQRDFFRSEANGVDYESDRGVSQNSDVGHTVNYWPRKVVRSHQGELFSQHKYRTLENLSGTIGSDVIEE